MAFLVFLHNKDGESLATDGSNPDATMMWQFDKIKSVRDFTRKHLGETGYRWNDDLERETHKITDYRVMEGRDDMTNEFKNLPWTHR